MSNLLFLAASLFVVIKSADLAIKYATYFAHILRLPKYVVGFLVVAVISILPETLIGIDASLRGVPAFGLGTLFGSNVADLTLVFAIVVFATVSGIKVGSKILEQNRWYPLLLALPIFVGFDGYYSRIEGVLLIAAGLFFFYWTFRENHHHAPSQGEHHHYHYLLNLLYLLLSTGGLIVGSHLTVQYGIALAESVSLSPILIGMLVVGLGTTLPELLFSIRAVRQNRDELALGDILGTVISDATIVVGILALISPFYFPKEIVYITAAFMVASALVLFQFMRSGKLLTKKEGVLLVLLYIVFVAVEYILHG
ncbi:MAG: sodium:calcium antiporter [Parcubacteria group bacterium]|nr:sodium:calcium antiporter [Parcubacteria group bacterium]